MNVLNGVLSVGMYMGALAGVLSGVKTIDEEESILISVTGSEIKLVFDLDACGLPDATGGYWGAWTSMLPSGTRCHFRSSVGIVCSRWV